MRCIIDANILIDLSRGDLLTWLFALPFQFAAPDGVLDELVEPDRGDCGKRGCNVPP